MVENSLSWYEKHKLKFVWLFQLAVAVLLFNASVLFKFVGHPDAVLLFSALGMEPTGRIIIGVIELIAAILLLLPRTAATAAFLSLSVSFGAIIAHASVLGMGTGLAAICLLAFSIIILIIRKKEIPYIGNTM